MAQIAWVIALNDAIAIDNDERRRRTHTEVEKIVIANWDTHERRDRELCRVVAIKIRQLFFGRRVLSTRDEPIELGRTNDDETLVTVFFMQRRQDGLLSLSVGTPMCPKEEHNDFALQVIRRRWLYAAEVIVDLKYRKRLTF